MGANLYNYNRQITIKSQLDHIYHLFFYLYDRPAGAGLYMVGGNWADRLRSAGNNRPPSPPLGGCITTGEAM